MKLSWSDLGSEGTRTSLVALLLCCAPLSQACGGIARFDHDGSGGSGAIGSSGGSVSNLSMGGSVPPPQGVDGFIAPIVGGSGAGGPIAPPQGGSSPSVGGSGGTGPIPPPQGGSGPINPPPMGDVTEGAKVWAMIACPSCHGENAAGLYGRNITPSRTAGIGAWNYKQFYTAVHYGIDPDGRQLCAAMPRFSESEISEQGTRNLYAYLSFKPAVDIPNTGSFCP